MSNPSTTRSGTFPEGISVQNIACADTIKEPTLEDVSPMQRFLAEDHRAQPWHNLSPITGGSHVASAKRSSATTTAAATNGWRPSDDGARWNQTELQPSTVPMAGNRHDAHQEKPSIVHDLKYVGHFFAG
ncbi:uncharacterized protein Z520_10430 [Fonsecaea multimorphosa CBS 102226]|uniref:Uncharacterized protein n=1 Tax=Fonsecaea multimorphosa CBS 102226 TaxID=1442371 RepID=A0A0D2GW08_9EURO|nr:uncharacterized protein Z520_10430 [Fonsecaea multimorphosa CBS 102226]KIX93805.1 hypothetical protein Z520_10430 [Fonsecaea multimorphosa CBS 102226]OAL19234.1 hypothetical protein AYO22_09995 [Fonsecaea multimorphosa]